MNGEKDGIVHHLVVNPWRQIWSPWCRRAQAVPGLRLTDADVDCPACVALSLAGAAK